MNSLQPHVKTQKPNAMQLNKPKDITPLSVILEDVVPIRIERGGYKIIAIFNRAFSQQSIWKIQLWKPGFEQAVSWVEVNREPIYRDKDNFAYSIINIHTLKLIIKAISDRDMWQSKIGIRLAVFEDNKWTYSNSVWLTTPIKPVLVKDETLASNQQLKLLYPLRDITKKVMSKSGKEEFVKEQIPDGRRLYKIKNGPNMPDGMHFFVSTAEKTRGHFETDPSKRGFDCVSFVMSVMGIASNINVGSGSETNSGEAVAKHLGALEVVSKVDHAKMVSYISSIKDPSFKCLILAYNDVNKISNHIVMCKAGLVYEFQNPRFASRMELQGSGYGGYATPVAIWRRKYNSTRYSIWAWAKAGQINDAPLAKSTNA